MHCINQVHRGPLSKLREEYENEKVIEPPKPVPKKPFHPKITATITKNDFHPVKEIIKDPPEIQDNKVVENNKINLEEIVVPPKPLPRTSRTGSICEPLEDPNNPPKPVARPRTNSATPIVTSINPNVPIAGGYKVNVVMLFGFLLHFFLFWHFFAYFIISLYTIVVSS